MTRCDAPFQHHEGEGAERSDERVGSTRRACAGYAVAGVELFAEEPESEGVLLPDEPEELPDPDPSELPPEPESPPEPLPVDPDDLLLLSAGLLLEEL
jgi:hypothetical protein